MGWNLGMAAGDCGFPDAPWVELRGDLGQAVQKLESGETRCGPACGIGPLEHTLRRVLSKELRRETS